MVCRVNALGRIDCLVKLPPNALNDLVMGPDKGSMRARIGWDPRGGLFFVRLQQEPPVPLLPVRSAQTLAGRR